MTAFLQPLKTALAGGDRFFLSLAKPRSRFLYELGACFWLLNWGFAGGVGCFALIGLEQGELGP